MRKAPAPDIPYDDYLDQQQYQQRSPSRSASRSAPRSRAHSSDKAAGDAQRVAFEKSTYLFETDAEADDDVEAGRVMVVQASG